FNTDGFVGFYLKAAPGLAGTVQVAPLLEDAGGTFDAAGGVLKTVVADGQWHLYEWDMDDPADFPNSFSDFFGGGGPDVTLDAQAHFESIAIIGTGLPATTVLSLDQIGYNNAGSLVPEPATLALAGLGLMGLVATSRKRR
ncbi:MAG TPA: PEP-CTERM sorting domain-containing protein, partial [Lacipirellula sp.]